MGKKWEHVAFVTVLNLASIASLLASCKQPGYHESAAKEASTTAGDSVADLRWIDRASQTLRMGQGLSPSDPLRQMVGKPKGQIIDILFKDPAFIKTMFDFYAYYFGFKGDETITTFRRSWAYNPSTKIVTPSGQTGPVLPTADFKIREHSSIVTGARSVVYGTSIQQMYQTDQPQYLSLREFDIFIDQIINPSPDGPQSAKSMPKELNLDALEKKLTNLIERHHTRLLAHVKEQQSGNPQKSRVIKGFCQKFSEFLNDKDFNAINQLSGIVELLDLQIACFNRIDLIEDEAFALLEVLKKASQVIKNAFTFIDLVLRDKVEVVDMSFVVRPDNLSLKKSGNLFPPTFWQTHLNSSTNFNRKRAAYVFKTYFCDDLTPVKIEIDPKSSDTRHGTDASCAACHYKLDPLAGFFRPYGAQGLYFGDHPAMFVFDDAKQIKGDPLKKYWSSWDFTSKNGPHNGVNIGLIRSATDPSRNSYGTTLDDLGRLIASDRRTYTCQTKRLADYFIGKGITYDPQWIGELAQVIQGAPTAQSGKAVQQVIKRLLMSQSFSERNPVAGTCYDRGTKGKESSQNTLNSLSCLVAATLEQHCVKCHGEDSARGGLNLASWSPQTGFSHLDDNEKQRAKLQSYQRILDRLGPSEEGPMMPLNSSMPDPDRLILKQWFEQKMTGKN